MAVVLGSVSGGLVCRDFDAMEAFDAWAAEYPKFAKELPTVETGRPGRHVYCRAHVDQIRQASRLGGGIVDLGDGELRGSGGYCLLPPSRHPSGHNYRWLVPLRAPIPFLDLNSCGFLKNGHATESNREDRDNRGQLRTTEAITAAAGVSVNDRMASVGFDQSAEFRETVEKAIRESLPTGVGRRNNQVFDLARALKATTLADSDPRHLQSVVREWHRRALPFIGTKPFEESWINFLRAWPRVKFPKGTGPMAQIFAIAVAATLPEVAERYEQQQLKLLVSLCRELQRAAGDGPFFLSVRTAARLLGVDNSTAWRWLFLLEQDGILKVEARGDQKTWKATRYRYIAESKTEYK